MYFVKEIMLLAGWPTMIGSANFFGLWRNLFLPYLDFFLFVYDCIFSSIKFFSLKSEKKNKKKKIENWKLEQVCLLFSTSIFFPSPQTDYPNHNTVSGPAEICIFSSLNSMFATCA